jgi:NAD/NADP transhydrogenase beta subunit
MYVLAWILFAMYIGSLTFRGSVVIGKAIAATDYKSKVKVDINWYRLVLDLTAFVFICIYLFA